MSVTLTAAGEALIARLQAEGAPLIIDTFIFADVPDLDHTQPISPAQGVPADHVVHEFAIPLEYRAYVNPNQVVYSALLGSDVGPFAFNWQGLYCSEHAVLVAVATFPRLEKRRYDPDTNTQGNNLTRNFLLEFSGARELTQLTVEAAVWQLDFTVRLKGIDERERLSNRDIYGRAAFLDDGWLLTHAGGAYRFEPGRGYVEGIRAALAEPAPVVPAVTPCDVWIDVSMQGQGSDVATVVAPLCLAVGSPCPDYVGAAPQHIPHYCEQVARIEADGSVTDLRPRKIGITPAQLGALTQEELDAALQKISSMPVGMPHYWPGVTPPPGSLAINIPQLLSRAAYPQLWAVAQASGNIISDAAWLAQAAVQESVGAWSSGDGATTFRPPLHRSYVRGADPANGRPVGMYQADDFKSHTHSTTSGGAGTVFQRYNSGSTDLAGAGVSGSTGGAETRPKTINWLPCIRAYDVAVNAAQVDMAALAASLSSKVDRSDWVTLVPDKAWRLPSGLILQVGPISCAAGGYTVTTFPLAFPVAILGVFPVGLQASGSTHVSTTLNHKSLANFGWTGFLNASGSAPAVAGPAGAVQGFFFAIGY